LEKKEEPSFYSTLERKKRQNVLVMVRDSEQKQSFKSYGKEQMIPS
jgi:hypothetical protein